MGLAEETKQIREEERESWQRRTMESVRVYILARELNMDSKDLLDICHAAGIRVKTQLSPLSPRERDLIVELVHRKRTRATPPRGG
jgi:hypothetical protein